MSLKILLLNKKVETCTGSLVTELFVLTAAHCVYGKDKKDLKIEKPFSHIDEYIRIGGSSIEFANNKSLKCIVIGFGTNAEHGGFVNQIMVKHGRKTCEGYDSVKIIDTWQQYICEIPSSKHKTYEGDSGGPMICNGLQYGVCSFSINFKGEDMQTVYMFIDYYRKWINDIIEP
ncbi:chymase-like, partial [Melanaphis sacchari]|uniref:chymase-like n=1 Tax=Melanaphis sacchari TaxID=742174 RepID=UPI000DC156AE